MTNEQNTAATPAPAAPSIESKIRGALEVEIKHCKEQALDLQRDEARERARDKHDPKFVNQEVNNWLGEICAGRREVWNETAARLEGLLASIPKV